MSALPARPIQAPEDTLPAREQIRAGKVRAHPDIAIQAQVAHTQAPNRRRGSAPDGLVDLIEPSWMLMAPILVGAMILTGISTLSVPN